MELYEQSGLWWLPSDPEQRISGTLFVTSGTLPRLKLLGSFHDTGGIGASVQPDIINGVSALGERVTLVRCHEVSWTLAAMSTSELEAQIVVVGAHFESISAVRFRKMQVCYTHLSNWARITGFQTVIPLKPPDGANIYTVQYAFPEAPRVSIDGTTITFIPQLTASGDRIARVHLEQRLFVEVCPSEPISLDSYLGEYYSHLQDFLALGVGAPVYPESVAAYLVDSTQKSDSPPNQGSEVAIYHGNRREQLGDPIHPLFMLFQLCEIREEFPGCLERWFRRADRLGPSRDLYLSTLYSPRLPDRAHLLSLTQALESYCRRVCGGAYLEEDKFDSLLTSLRPMVEAAVPEGDARKAMLGRLRYLNEHTARTRVRELVGGFSHLIKPLIPDPDRLVRTAYATRDYLTHYDIRFGKSAATGVGLHVLVQQLRFLLEVVFLHEIGLSEGKIASLIERNQGYAHIRNLMRNQA